MWETLKPDERLYHLMRPTLVGGVSQSLNLIRNTPSLELGHSLMLCYGIMPIDILFYSRMCYCSSPCMFQFSSNEPEPKFR